MEWYPWYPLAFRRNTYCLSLAEDGAYRRLIDEYMINRRGLPDDDAALARILGVGLPEWMAVAPRVRPFFKARDGVLIHKRCDDELDAQNNRMKRFSERGKKAAFAKYSKINAVSTRRMLVPPTLQSKKLESSLVDEEHSEPEPPKKELGEEAKKYAPSPYLEAQVARKFGS
jgi:uncharacterized protein YdaU (DUF1376 family)